MEKNGDKDIVSKENYIGTALLEGGIIGLTLFLVKAEDYLNNLKLSERFCSKMDTYK